MEWLRRRTGAVLVGLVVVGAISGCADAGHGEPASAGSGGASSSPSASPMPIEQVVQFDPTLPALVQSSRELVGPSDGFASAETRAALLAAADATAAHLDVVQLSMAGGPAASQADPPVDEKLLEADTAALLDAIGVVREGVVAMAIEVVNVGAADAEQSVRDVLYLAIVAEQSAPVTADTPRRLLGIITATRDAQAAQTAYLDEQARQAAAAAEAAASDDSSGESGGSTGFREIPWSTYFPDCIWTTTHTDPLTGEEFTVSTPLGEMCH